MIIFQRVSDPVLHHSAATWPNANDVDSVIDGRITNHVPN